MAPDNDGSNPANVSLVAPDGSTGPLPAPLADNGTRSTDDDIGSYAERQQEAEREIDERLGEIYDKNMAEEATPGTDKTTQPRTPAGKFAQKDGAPVVTKESEDQSHTKPGEQAQPAIAMPKSWPSEKSATWEKLSPDDRKFFAERETRAHNAISQQGQALSNYKPLGELLSKNRDVFERHGADPVTGLTRLFDVQRKLDTDAEGTLAAIAQMYGVEAKFGASTATAEPAEEGQVDPHLVAVRQRLEDANAQIAHLNSRLDKRDQSEISIARAQEQRLQQQTSEGIQGWAKDKPHYEEVRSTMSVLVASGEANSLDEAYDMACNAKPATRTKIAEAKTAADKEVREKDDKARLAEAGKHTSEAKRTASIQVGAGTRRTSPAASNKAWNDDSYLSDLHDRVQQGHPT